MHASLRVGSDLIDEKAGRTRNPVFLQCEIVQVFKAKGPEDGIESAKPRERAVGVSDGFEFLQDKCAFSKKWRLRRYSGRHSLDVPCPSRNSMVTDVSHLEGMGLSIRVEPCINSVQRCDLAILVARAPPLFGRLEMLVRFQKLPLVWLS
ncbi:hypothetical protein TSMEX_007603 [Taenia solium]|eukprot:TsM_000988100 transcript=TsM_000988100 gene=TsM_000988100